MNVEYQPKTFITLFLTWFFFSEKFISPAQLKRKLMESSKLSQPKKVMFAPILSHILIVVYSLIDLFNFGFLKGNKIC